MEKRQRFSSGGPWEEQVGYSRAVRVGNHIAVSGTTAAKDETPVAHSAGEQTRAILTTIQNSIEGLGGKLEDVIRTRIFITDLNDWGDVSQVHGEFFRDIRPAATMVVVKGLIREDLKVEIEADAIVSDPS